MPSLRNFDISDNSLCMSDHLMAVLAAALFVEVVFLAPETFDSEHPIDGLLRSIGHDSYMQSLWLEAHRGTSLHAWGRATNA